MPDNSKPPQPSNDNKAKIAYSTAACIAAACSVALPLAQRWEGFAPKVYRDPANIPTYCYGETTNVNPLAIYSKTQCAKLLREREAKDYAPKILQCIPQLAEPKRKEVFGALIDVSYNAGWQGVCTSSMRTAIYDGDWKGACKAIRTYYITARYRGRPRPAKEMIAHGWHWDAKAKAWRTTLKGLVNRRNDEANVCLLAA